MFKCVFIKEFRKFGRFYDGCHLWKINWKIPIKVG